MTCIYVLLLKQGKVFLLVGSLEKRNRADPGYLQRIFSKTFHALKGVWSSCLFSLTTQQSTFEFQTRGWLLHFLFQSDHKTLLSTSIVLQPSPGSLELCLESSPCLSCCCCTNSPLSCPSLRPSLDPAGKSPVCHINATRDQLCAHCSALTTPDRAAAAAPTLPASTPCWTQLRLKWGETLCERNAALKKWSLVKESILSLWSLQVEGVIQVLPSSLGWSHERKQVVLCPKMLIKPFLYKLKPYFLKDFPLFRSPTWASAPYLCDPSTGQ